jgi:SulP family sulfate permease
LGKDCYELIKNAGAIVQVNILEDPKYKVAEDALA